MALTSTELRLLLEFAAHPGVVRERHTLLRNVWEYGWDGDSRVVDLQYSLALPWGTLLLLCLLSLAIGGIAAAVPARGAAALSPLEAVAET